MRRVAIGEPATPFELMPETARVGHHEEQRPATDQLVGQALHDRQGLRYVLQSVQRDDDVETGGG